jgi:hypothetical protein
MDQEPEATKLFFDVNGAEGECAFAKLAGLYWRMSVNAKKDEPDVDPDFQVRTSEPHDRSLIIRPDDPQHFRYALVTGCCGEFQVHGWIFGMYARRDEWFEDRGGRGKPVWWVPKSALTEVE